MGSWAYGHIYTRLWVWYIGRMRSRAFKKLYKMANCSNRREQQTKEQRLAIYLVILLPTDKAKWKEFFDLLPGLKDSEWKEMKTYMDGFILRANPTGPNLDKRLDWITGLDTIYAFGDA
jgi:hypothetical protein